MSNARMKSEADLIKEGDQTVSSDPTAIRQSWLPLLIAVADHLERQHRARSFASLPSIASFSRELNHRSVGHGEVTVSLDSDAVDFVASPTPASSKDHHASICEMLEVVSQRIPNKVPPIRSALCKFTLLTLLASGLAGCAQWKESASISKADATPNTASQDPKNRIVIEVDFINTSLDTMDADQTAGLWQWIDETSIDAKLRQRLLNNGIRIGRVTNHERFQNKLDSISVKQDVVEEFLNQAAVASEVSHGEQRIPMRLGRRYELALRQPFEGSHVALLRSEGETIGRTLNNAQYFLAMTASQAETAQQIRLHIRPEIQYGAARQKWVSSDTAIRIDTRRETWSLDMLDINVVAASGDTIVIAPDAPTHGLASKMLSGSGTDHHQQQLVVLIHVAQIPSPADQLAIEGRFRS